MHVVEMGDKKVLGIAKIQFLLEIKLNITSKMACHIAIRSRKRRTVRVSILVASMSLAMQ